MQSEGAVALSSDRTPARPSTEDMSRTSATAYHECPNVRDSGDSRAARMADPTNVAIRGSTCELAEVIDVALGVQVVSGSAERERQMSSAEMSASSRA